MNFFNRPSPNFDERQNGLKPEMVIIHYTGMKNTAAALAHLSDPASKVSCHYLIDEAGHIHRMVGEDKRAWHAGISAWRGQGDINSRSIGIEISNRGGAPYTPEQLVSLTRLCSDLMRRHGIPPENIQGHSDIAPHRKQDPGQHFPWQNMARQGIGHWPRPSLRDRFNTATVAKNPERLKRLFKTAGYPVDAFGQDKPSLAELVTAFQRHYEPAVFKKAKNIGKPTARTIARLRALARRIKP